MTELGAYVSDEQRPDPTGAMDAGLGWLADDLVARVAHIGKTLILPRDGLAASASSEFGQAGADGTPA